MKAVIMAGGSGKRLRPLTSTTPKPLVRVFSKPVISYILDLLKSNSYDEVAVTLGYMSEKIEDYLLNDYCGKMKITAVKEETPLGTAGGVKIAASSFKEPFLVISGDSICDFDLEKAMEFHISHNSKLTIILTRVSDPREYGVVEFDSNDKVKAFTEKPMWSGAVSDCVNTGIYIINPEIMNFVPENMPFDFSKDLFPLLMKKGIDIYTFLAEGYWCDIGSASAYRKCCEDVLNGMVKITLPQVAQGVFVNGKLPSGNYNIIPPCYIGKDVEIGDNSVIGPYSVIDDGCMVGENAKIRFSVMLPFSVAYPYSSVNSAILCENAVVKSGAKICENSVIGAGSTVCRNTVIARNVYVWPQKTIGDGQLISENIKYGCFDYELFGDDGVEGTMGVEMNAVTASLIGQAIASSNIGAKVGVSSDGSISAKAVVSSLIGGLMAHGSHIRTFGDTFLSQMMFYTAFCGLDCGIFVSCRNSQISIKICGEGGLPLSSSVHRDIENRIKYGEFRRPMEENLKDVSDMTGVGLMYRRELIRQSPTELSEVGCNIRSENEKITMLLDDCLYRLGCRRGDELTFKINRDGTLLSAFHRNCGWVPHDKLMSVCCMYETQNGRDVAVPFSSPRVLDEIARLNGRKVLRYYNYPSDLSDTGARTLALSQVFMRDALFMAVKILGIICESGIPFDKFISSLPQFYISRKKIKLSCNPSEIASLLKNESFQITKEGVILKYPDGTVYMTPSRNGKMLRMTAEAYNYEFSKELCERTERLFDGH